MVSNVTFVNIKKWKLFIKQKIFLQKITTVTNYTTSLEATSRGKSVAWVPFVSKVTTIKQSPKKRADYKCIDGKYCKGVSLKFILYTCLEITPLSRYDVMQETLGKHVMYVKGECMLFAPIKK